MNNEVTTTTGMVNYNPGKASLLEMRADPKRFPRINAMPKEEAVAAMAKIVTQAFLYRGSAADPTNIQFISSALVDELLNDDKYGAAYLSLAEVQVVVKRAVLGGSEMFGISVSSLYKVLLDYVRGEGHYLQKKLEEERRKKAPSSPMLTAYAGEFMRNNKTRKK